MDKTVVAPTRFDPAPRPAGLVDPNLRGINPTASLNAGSVNAAVNSWSADPAPPAPGFRPAEPDVADSRRREVAADTTTVVIASADDAFRATLQQQLSGETSIQIIGEARDLAGLLQTVSSQRPRLVLLDNTLQRNRSELAFALLRRSHPAVKTLLFADQYDNDMVSEAVKDGAHGVLLKTSNKDERMKAIQGVLAGDIWIRRRVMADVLEQLLQQNQQAHATTAVSPINELTDRERQIVDCVGFGMTNKEIGRTLGISDTTVKTHLRHVFGKLKVNRRLQLLLNREDGEGGEHLRRPPQRPGQQPPGSQAGA